MTTYTTSPANPRTSRRKGFLRACATAAVLLTGGLAGSAAFTGAAVASTDVVDAARAALPDRGGITHVRMGFLVEYTNDAPRQLLTEQRAAHLLPTFGAEDGPIPVGEVERWIAVAPLRDRAAWIHPQPDGRIETDEESYADGVLREWHSRDGTLNVITLSNEERTAYESSRLESQRTWLNNVAWGADPVAGVRAMLDGGMLRSAGRITHEGRAVLRLTGEEPGTEENGSPGGPIEYEYLVEPNSFAPVRVLETKTMRAADENGRGAERFALGWSFSIYERLPLDASTQHLLVAGSGHETVAR